MIDLFHATADLPIGPGFGPLEVLAKTTVVLLIAYVVTRCMRRFSASARHGVWLTMLTGVVITPVLSAWTPLPLPVLPASQTAESVAASPALHERAAPEPAPGRVERRSAPVVGTLPLIQRTGQPASSRPGGLLTLLFAAWASVGLGVLAFQLRSFRVARRIVRRSDPLDADAWLNPLWESCDRLGIDEPPRLLRSVEVAMPFACGYRRPVVVLPQTADGWSPERRRAVLLHELAHVRRGDLYSHLLARIACALYWFHPLVWKAARELRSESELACDDVVVRCGTPAADYAEHLLEIVTTARGNPPPSAALAMARRAEFEGRILSILDPDLRRTAPNRRHSLPSVAALLLLAFCVGAARPVPREEPRKRAERLKLFEAMSPDVRGSADVAQDGSDAPGAVNEDPPNSSQDSDAPGRGSDAHLSEGRSERPSLLARVLRSDTSAVMRRTAAWGLREHTGDPAALDALSHSLRHDPDAGVREMTAWSLAAPRRDQTQADVLALALQGDSDARVRATAAWAMGTLGDPALSRSVAAALADPSVEVRTRAAWALGTSAPAIAPGALIGMLREQDPKARSLAAWALHRIGDRSAVSRLDAALQTEIDAEVHLALVRARASLGEPFGSAFHDLLDSSDPSVRDVVLGAFAGRGAGHWHWHWHDARPSP